MSNVRTRFAPSPTGNLHIGGVRTALFSWLYAKKHQGEFILRIEDTDTQRSTEQSTHAILKNLAWLGITPTHAPIFQSDRIGHYQQMAEQLVESNQAYYCDCSETRLEQLRTAQKQQGLKPQYDRQCRERHLKPEQGKNTVIRLKTPIEGETSFHDSVYGNIKVQNKELDDLIIIRSDGSPTYNFAVVLDDIENKITHIIRGDDHINNTARQLHLYHLFDAPIPVFAHCPMVLGHDGKRLSKRHGATDVGSYRTQGFLPIAVLNYLIRLGWSSGDQELFSLEEMIELFDLNGINRASPKFDSDKFLWINQQQLHMAPKQQILTGYHEQLNALAINNTHSLNSKKIIDIYAKHLPTLQEIAQESAFLFRSITWQGDEALYQEFIAPNQDTLTFLYQALSEITDTDWHAEYIMQTIKHISKTHQLKMPQVGMPLRIALSGKKSTPDIAKIASLLGKKETLCRLNAVIENELFRTD